MHADIRRRIAAETKRIAVALFSGGRFAAPVFRLCSRSIEAENQERRSRQNWQNLASSRQFLVDNATAPIL